MGASKNWVLAAAILGSSMTFIDGSAVNVVLPILQRDFQAGSGDVQWVVEAYALFLSALILVGGSLGDLLGRRKMFVLGVAIFAASSAACALAPTIAVLIAARAVQGIGAALAMPESLALISATYTGEARGRAIGTWSGFASLTGAAGPVIGGFLAQVASWRYVFVINLPLALIVLWIAARHVPESRDENMARTIDLSGAALATLGLGALVFGLIQWQGAAQPTVSAIAIGLGCLLLIAFVLVERRVAHPMLPLGLFRSRPFTIANVYTLLLYTALGGSLYFLPFMLIDVQRYTPTAAGAAFLPFVLLQFVFSRWAGSLVARVGARRPLILGALLCTLAFVVFALPGIGGIVLGDVFSGGAVVGNRRRVLHRSADHDRLRLVGSGPQRNRLGDQQRDRADRGAGGGGGLRRRAGGSLRPRLRRSSCSAARYGPDARDRRQPAHALHRRNGPRRGPGR